MTVTWVMAADSSRGEVTAGARNIMSFRLLSGQIITVNSAADNDPYQAADKTEQVCRYGAKMLSEHPPKPAEERHA